jgi:hypothetical protein
LDAPSKLETKNINVPSTFRKSEKPANVNVDFKDNSKIFDSMRANMQNLSKVARKI